MGRGKIWLAGAGLVGVAVLGGTVLTRAATTHTGTAGGTLASNDSTTGIDADAVAALDKMGKYLRTLKAIQIKATVAAEEVATDGQKVQTMRNLDLLAERPNKLRVEVADERQPRVFYYDGKKFTLWAPLLKFYAQVDAPATIGELADQLEDKYNVDLPLVDLFRWGTPESGLKDLTSAVDVGPASVDGVTCEQYMFRQDGLDWQVWIQDGDYPLPRKLVLTTTTDEARPQHTSVWTWNLTPSYNAEEFAFTPPPGAKPIPFATARARVNEKQPGAK
jgi:hypothetical protein